MKYGKGPRTRSHLLLTLPLLDFTSSFLVFYQLKLKGNRRREGKEREVREERQQGGHFNFL